MDIVLSNEEDAFHWLNKAKTEIEDLSSIRFDGWPHLVFRFEGKDFHGSVPTRIMPSILELQKEIHRVFCQLVYGDGNLKRLTQEDRERLELVVKVEQGSSVFGIELPDKLTELAQAALNKMSGSQTLTAVIVVSCLIAGSYSWKGWVTEQSREKQLDVQVQMSKLERDRLKILAEAVNNAPRMKETADGVNEFRNSLIHKMQPADKLRLPDSSDVIDGHVAKVITHSPRAESKELRIDGRFVILSVDSGGQKGYRIKVRRAEDDKQFQVTIPDGTLTKEQKNTLKNNEWAKQPVLMKINAKELRGEITRATLVAVNTTPKEAR